MSADCTDTFTHSNVARQICFAWHSGLPWNVWELVTHLRVMQPHSELQPLIFSSYWRHSGLHCLDMMTWWSCSPPCSSISDNPKPMLLIQSAQSCSSMCCLGIVLVCGKFHRKNDVWDSTDCSICVTAEVTGMGRSWDIGLWRVLKRWFNSRNSCCVAWASSRMLGSFGTSCCVIQNESLTAHTRVVLQWFHIFCQKRFLHHNVTPVTHFGWMPTIIIILNVQFVNLQYVIFVIKALFDWQPSQLAFHQESNPNVPCEKFSFGQERKSINQWINQSI